ncbi:pumilio homolog 23 [Cornus florida]|uniref:pumilio homolog 23 n=1 Tax=Cornus florida TaxID=4283 RepID=UPI00289F9103|nr:pumilio homolog 23 [Cornus florida]
MVAIGLKALPSRKHKINNLTEDRFMGGEHNSYDKPGRKKSMNRKAMKKHTGFDGDHSTENLSGGGRHKTSKAQKFSKNQNASVAQAPFVRKQVDPETAKYFLEITNVIEGTEVDLDERSVICGNALEETRGKELEVATDYIISHTLQTLLEGCDVDHLCGFLRGCAKDFGHISMDRSGSHVAETALKSLAVHLQDNETHSLIEETLTTICQEIILNPVDVMCNCYGSHVLRSLLCLLKGMRLDSSEFHVTKSSSVLAERLNFRPSRLGGNVSQDLQQGFPDLLKFLVSEMLNCARKDIETLQHNQYSSLVLQTALKLLAGQEQDLLHIILILLGYDMENDVEENFIDCTAVPNLLSLMKESAYSHLMEVMLEVSPETLYNELFTKVFRNSLFHLSSDPCGNFVVQALVSHARYQSHMDFIWEELGTKFKDLLERGRSGVIASLIAASQRLHSHEQKCCQALVAAVCSALDSPTCIVPRILYLESYIYCEDKSNWNWPKGVKMHVMGSLVLQTVFRLPNEFIQPYVASITSMEADHVLEASKDTGGARVIEAFLSSNASGKHKRRLVIKLQGHFGELSMHHSGSFTVEKCFNASNVSLRETIVSELCSVQTELSKTKHGHFLLRKLDVEGFAKQPDQWKLRQSSKQSTYKEFYATFGSKETKSSRNDVFLAESHQTSKPEKLKEMRKEIDACLSSAVALSPASQFLSPEGSGRKRRLERAEQHGKKFTRHATDDDVLKSKNKKRKKNNNNNNTGTENAYAESKPTDSVGYHQKESQSVDKKEKKRRKKDGL